MADVSDEPQEISSLRQALSFSPENTALHTLLADKLLAFGRFQAAEAEYRQILAAEPDHGEAAIGLAEAFVQLDKRNEAFALLEPMEQRGKLGQKGLLTYARLLSQTPELAKAAQVYRAYRDQHGGEADEELERELAAFLIVEEEDPGDDDDAFGDRLPAGELPPGTTLEAERPKVTFTEVGGMDAVKEQIRMKIIHPMQNAELFKAYGKSIGGGILLYGPPGCGKTLLARATAGEVKASFTAVGLHDVLDMWIGQSEKNLHELFEQARRRHPSVLFFDEVDALGASRSDLKHSASRHTINQFLNELDGVDGNNDGLLVLAATNAPWHLDSALRRPGRFDRIIFVPPPDEPARESILRVMLTDKPVDRIDYATVAKKTEGFSGADLKAVVDRAIEDKLDEAMKKGGLVPVTTKDLAKAAKNVKPSTADWFATAKNYAMYANQGGLYDDILDYLKIKK